MIKKLLVFLEIDKPELSEREELTVPLATAVLFYEVMRADHNVSAEEIDTFKTLVTTNLNIAPDDVTDLLDRVEKAVADSLDYMQFTRLIHENCGLQEKRRIISFLWQLAASDGVIDPHEEYLIRKFADLLYLSHSDFIQAKLSNVSL